MSEAPYDPYIPSGQSGSSATRDGTQRTAALQAVGYSLPFSPSTEMPDPYNPTCDAVSGISKMSSEQWHQKPRRSKCIFVAVLQSNRDRRMNRRPMESHAVRHILPSSAKAVLTDLNRHKTRHLHGNCKIGHVALWQLLARL